MNFEQRPRKIVYYALPGDPKGGALFVYGNENAKRMALMSAGFPDDQKPLIPLASRLASESDTLVGLTCFPGFDDRADKPWKDHKVFTRDGYSFEEVATCFREAAKALRSESKCPTKPKFTGIFHDWGVIAGAIWANRAIADGSENAPNELVYFDVLPPKPSPTQPLFSLTAFSAVGESLRYQLVYNHFYQLVLGLVFAIQCYVSNLIAIICLIFGSIPLVVLPISPTKKVDDDMRKVLGFPAISHLIYMCYPYFHIAYRQKYKLDEDCTLPQDLSGTPVLYMYGTDKRAKFHTDEAIEVLQRQQDKKMNKTKVVAVEEAGHYLYLQKPDICYNCIVNFMSEQSSGMKEFM